MHALDLGIPSTGFLVWHLSLRWQTELSRALAPLGITHTDYGVLASLHGLSRSGIGPSQRELADISGLEPMYVSKLARALESAGFIERKQHPADPRARQLSLTRKGTRTVSSARRVVRKLDQQRLAVLGGPSSTRATELKDALVELLRHSGESAPRPTQTRRRARKPIKEKVL